MTSQDPSQPLLGAEPRLRPDIRAKSTGAGSEAMDPRAKNQTRIYRVELHNIKANEPAGKWQKVRENIKDILLPLAALAITFITWYFGYQFNRRNEKLAEAEARNKLIDALNREKPGEREQAAMSLAQQGKDALPALLYFALETDDDPWQTSACDVLRGIVRAGDRLARTLIRDRLTSDIKDGDRVAFRGGVNCVAKRVFGGNQEVKLLLQAIEARLGSDGRLCKPETDSVKDPDNQGITHAVEAEYNFPRATGHAPDFLAGVFKNCPDDLRGAREAAITNLAAVFKAVYGDDCDKKYQDALRILRPAVPEPRRAEIDKASQSSCPQ